MLIEKSANKAPKCNSIEYDIYNLEQLQYITCCAVALLINKKNFSCVKRDTFLSSHVLLLPDMCSGQEIPAWNINSIT